MIFVSDCSSHCIHSRARVASWTVYMEPSSLARPVASCWPPAVFSAPAPSGKGAQGKSMSQNIRNAPPLGTYSHRYLGSCELK